MPWLPFGTGCVVNNRIWNADNVTMLEVGQLPKAEANYKQDDRWILPPGFKPKHICNAEWFATGEPWPTELPPADYDDYWIPVCCGDINHFARGGFAIGGPITHAFGFKHAPAGGLAIGGPITHAFGFEHAPAGGLSIGGPITHAFNIDHAPAGGFALGGPIEHDWSGEHKPQGGFALGGPIDHVFSGVHLVEGGLSIGGPITHAFGFAHLVEGGLSIGGPITHAFNPGQPTPGTSCASAATVNQSQTYNYTISGFSAHDWFTFTLPSTGTWHITTTGVGGPSGATLTPFSGGSCPAPNPLSASTLGPPKWVWSGTSGDVIRLRFDGPFFGSASYTFVWDSGP